MLKRSAFEVALHFPTQNPHVRGGDQHMIHIVLRKLSPRTIDSTKLLGFKVKKNNMGRACYGETEEDIFLVDSRLTQFFFSVINNRH